MAETPKLVHKTPWANTPTSDLWQSFQQGDRSAFQHVYRTHVNDLYNYGMKIVPDDGMVKDCIQELFLDLWRTKSRLAKVSNIKYYLLKALRWKIIHQKTKNDAVHHISPYDAAGQEFAVPSYERQLIDKQTKEADNAALARAFKQLPDRQREVLTLVFYQKLSYEEVSTVMAINVKSIYTLVWKAFNTLKRHMS
jgi:RNA polymerase sigma factor (sigma-70 family)